LLTIHLSTILVINQLNAQNYKTCNDFSILCDIFLPFRAMESPFNEEIVTGNTIICDSIVLFLYYRHRYCVFESLKLQSDRVFQKIFHANQNLWEWIFESSTQKSLYLHTALDPLLLYTLLQLWTLSRISYSVLDLL